MRHLRQRKHRQCVHVWLSIPPANDHHGLHIDVARLRPMANSSEQACTLLQLHFGRTKLSSAVPRPDMQGLRGSVDRITHRLGSVDVIVTPPPHEG